MTIRAQSMYYNSCVSPVLTDIARILHKRCV